jgi:hypothetical protein
VNALQRVVARLFGFSYIQLASAPGFDLVGDAKSHSELMAAIRRNDPQLVEKVFAEAVESWMDYALATTEINADAD